jgi:ketosteroid isomerase-like protein
MHIHSRAFCVAMIFCGLVGQQAVAGPKDDLMMADKAFSAASVAQGSDAAFLTFMADDARIFGTGDEPPLIGKAAAQAHYAARKQAGPRTTALSWTPENAEVSADSLLGYTDGHWLFQGRNANGALLRFTGHYMTVWRRVPSGGWKVIADMGTTDPAPPSP